MKHSHKISLLMTGLSLVTGVAVFGSTAGTLAWYMYSAKASVSFIGTSVRKSVLLHIGIVDDEEYFTQSKLNELNLKRGERTEEDGHSIVWTSSNSGLNSTVISEYLSHTDFATNTLSPVTSKSRSLSNNGALDLYTSPDYGDTVDKQLIADHSEYVQIPFAFKILDNDDKKIADEEIWLTETVVQASGQHIDEAVRVFIDNSHRKFILNPSDDSDTSGSTVVGGLLDLDNDKCYDFETLNHHEIVYGEYSGSKTYPSSTYGIDWEHADFDNVNDTKYETQSTFYAKHNENSYVVGGVTFDKVAEYETIGSIKPSINSTTGDYEGGEPVCYTDSSDRIGYMTLTIYIEGWDHAVVNTAINYRFNLGLKFEINRV